MSLSLIITKRPCSEMVLKNPLASKIMEETGGVAGSDSLPFLRGVFAASLDASDRKVIERMISGIEGGAVFDLREQY